MASAMNEAGTLVGRRTGGFEIKNKAYAGVIAVGRRTGGFETNLPCAEADVERWPPHRRLRKEGLASIRAAHSWPPHRRLRNAHFAHGKIRRSWPPHRRLRNAGSGIIVEALRWPPHRRLRKHLPRDELIELVLAAAQAAPMAVNKAIGYTSLNQKVRAMQILVVDESEKKAWRRSRRVLAATLYRRGSRTFTGRLSKEGLQVLVKELKQVASKNTSIVVYRLTAHAEFEVLARVGSTAAWGEEGWYANRVTTRVTTAGPAFSPVEKLLRSLVRLAALFHDLGKANQQFQDMLSGKSGAQHLRHELVSMLMLDQAFEGLENPFAALAEDAERVFSGLSGRLASQNVPAQGVDAGFLRNAAAGVLESMLAPGIPSLTAAMKYLVLTHHRQIDASVGGGDPHDRPDVRKLSLMEGHPSLRRHVNKLDDRVSFSASNMTLATGEKPWETVSWARAVQSNAASIVQVLRNNPELLAHLERNPVAWVKNVALLARPTLILADHLASALKTPAANAGPHIFANTCHDKRGRQVMADTLSVHLLKTRYAVDPYFKGMTGLHKPLPAWTPPQGSLLFQRGPARFQWQDEAAQLVGAVDDIEDRPFMAMVVSGTGAGKTLGAPKILAAACGNKLRYTCALGLRSLTLQTGAAYRSQLGLTERECLTVVGDALYAKLSTSDADAKALQGSESLVEVDDLVLDGDGTGDRVIQGLEFDTQHRAGLATGKGMAMTEVPILSCTVDHVMGASSLNKGMDTRLSLRLATADLVLDEIDNYSLEDLQALGRLVHHAGCHGRRVVLMSATVSDTVLKALHQAWLEGLDAWGMRTQRPARPVVALVSNQVGSRVVEGDAAAVGRELDQFLGDIGQVLGATPARTVAKVVATKETLEETFHALLKECIGFARQHHTVCSASGQRLSAGFVRFNQVAHCRQFARFLMEDAVLPEDVDMKVQCYHRRMPMFHLTYVEKALNALWRRDDDQSIFRHPLITQWPDDGRLRLIVVATTSIQETGRDHDYDFAIAEPWSSRSLVQLAGRVRRHRGGVAAAPNVGVLSCELNQLAQSKGNTALELGREHLFLGNGASTTFAEATGMKASPVGIKLRAKFLQKYPALGAAWPEANVRPTWFSAEFFRTGIDARTCLIAQHGQRAALSALEHFAQDKRMAHAPGVSGFLALEDITRQNGTFVELSWNRHNHVVQFRRSDGELGQLTLDPATDFKSIAVVETSEATGRVEARPRAPSPSKKDWRGGTAIRNVARALVRTDLLTRSDVERELGVLAKDPTALRLCHSFEVRLPRESTGGQGHADTVNVDFDPLLGADGNSAELQEAR